MRGKMVLPRSSEAFSGEYLLCGASLLMPEAADAIESVTLRHQL